MNAFFYYIILLLGNLSYFSNIKEKNNLKQEAYRAYQEKNYDTAAALYQKLANINFIVSPEICLNLANAYFMNNDTTHAKIHYLKLLGVHNNNYSSIALTQLGLMAAQNKDSSRALDLFKESIIKKSTNETAQFNYELLRSKISHSKSESNDIIKKQKNESQAANVVKQSEERKETLKNIPLESISQEKALQILEAMKMNEIRFLQNKKTSHTYAKNQPDW